MKNIFTFILAISFLQLSAAQVKKVKSEVKKVTVFLNKAQVTSEALTDLESGTTEIKITRLPFNLDKKSINVAGKGNFTILSVKHDVVYGSQNSGKSMQAVSLADSIKKLDYEIKILDNELSSLAIEENVILENQKIAGHETGLEVKELEKLAEFIRERFNEIKKRKMDDNILISEKIIIKSSLERELSNLQEDLNENTSEITITVLAKENTNAQLSVSYIVYDAGWYPVYDIRVKNTSEPATLTYKANVFQRTGFDWKNIKVNISTANPTLNGEKPNLNIWNLDFTIPDVERYSAPSLKTSQADNFAGFSSEEAVLTEEEKQFVAANPISDYNQTSENQLAVNFEIGLPVTIKSGENEELIEIKTNMVNATYSYSTVPKYEQDAFLMAYLKGWEDLNLLKGKANIYFDNSFVGESEINPKQTQDSLSISLGRDKKIAIERKIVKDYSSKKFIGFVNKQEFTYQIIVRNTKSEAIDIIVDDQIPVSKNKEINVELVDKGGANFEENSGKLTWPLKLAKGETKTLTFKFSVKYPKGKVVDNL